MYARSLAAARRWCAVTTTENLPFHDASFDVVLSTFGVMFTPDQQKAAAELARVCKPGGQIGLDELFGAKAATVRTATRSFNFRYRSPQQWLDIFRSFYGPMNKTFAGRNRISMNGTASTETPRVVFAVVR